MNKMFYLLYLISKKIFYEVIKLKYNIQVILIKFEFCGF